MNKFVYLYELDSVRNNPKEIELGQKALFEEIVKNGNIVILAFNQLTDSEAFLSAVKDKKTYESIVGLFTLGALKVSQFGGTRTASQYMQNSIEKCLGGEGNKFLFSGLPVLCTDNEMLKTIGDALRYSDIGVLREMAEKEPDGEEKERLEYIERFIRMILLLSVEEPAGHPAKQTRKRSFVEFYGKIFEVLFEITDKKAGEVQNEEIKKLLPKSLEILRNIERSLEEAQQNNRTNWVNRINEAGEKTDAHGLAEAIVDLCYNYTVEDSICEVSRHYLEEGGECGRFEDDFLQRLTEYWKSYRKGVHTFCKGDKEEREKYEVALPYWDTAVRVVREIKKQGGMRQDRQEIKKQGGEEQKIKKQEAYEENYTKEKKSWRIKLIRQMGARFGTAFIYIVLFCLADLGINLAEDSLFEAAAWLQPEIIPEWVWEVIYSTVLFGIIGSVVSEIFHLPDILESLKGIVTGVKDSYRIIKAPKHIAYYNVLWDRNNSATGGNKKL